MRIARTLPLLLLLSASALLAQSAPLAAPGLPLRGGNLPWALDQYDGKPELVPIHRSTIEVNNHKGSNVAGSLANPFFKPKLTTELAGVHGRNALHSATPAFFVHAEPDPDTTANADTPTWSLVRASIDKDHRVFAKVQFTQLTGNAKRVDGLVPTQIETLADGWLKITPKDPLTPGEYALMPVMKTANTFSVYIFDFTVDPSLPNATDAVLPRESAQ